MLDCHTLIGTKLLAALLQSKHGKAESGTRASYGHGRPDVRSILKNVQANFSHVPDIHVIAAGEQKLLKTAFDLLFDGIYVSQ